MKAKPLISEEGNTIEVGATVGYHIYCPGCKHTHFIHTNLKFSPIAWGFNGNTEKPTFTPSLLCNPDEPKRRCHTFITNGRIQFLPDCFHELAGQTVDLIDVDES